MVIKNEFSQKQVYTNDILTFLQQKNFLKTKLKVSYAHSKPQHSTLKERIKFRTLIKCFSSHKFIACLKSLGLA